VLGLGVRSVPEEAAYPTQPIRSGLAQPLVLGPEERGLKVVRERMEARPVRRTGEIGESIRMA